MSTNVHDLIRRKSILQKHLQKVTQLSIVADGVLAPAALFGLMAGARVPPSAVAERPEVRDELRRAACGPSE